MPNTYQLISSNVLGSSAASVTFSAIPSTYTDLVLRISARDTNTGAIIANTSFTFNGSSGSLYSITKLIGDGSAASSSRRSNITSDEFYYPGSNAGMSANTFGSVEIYIPSYTASQNKPFSTFGVTENNSATAGDTEIDAWANLYRDTAAISSIAINAYVTFSAGSSFYLYGIKNS
jgi:hypothetical protein